MMGYQEPLVDCPPPQHPLDLGNPTLQGVLAVLEASGPVMIVGRHTPDQLPNPLTIQCVSGPLPQFTYSELSRGPTADNPHPP